MPRRGNVPKRDVLPDPMYGSKVVTKLINQIMLDGKKGTAQTIVYDAFKIMGEKLNMESKVMNKIPSQFGNMHENRKQPVYILTTGDQKFFAE